MDSENANLENRLRSVIIQLGSESGVFEKIIYKSKNQHRGSLYFQPLLKVRRDLRLLHSARIDHILNSLFSIIRGKNPNETASHSKLGKKKALDGSHTYLDRLLGVARLLSQMVEPVLKAAIQISLLLAKSFFMGFSLTLLACLARLRVLVQQMLIDVVTLFNLISAHSQKHSVKLYREGIEVFVDHFSSSGNLTLDCLWEVDKFVLHEITQCDRKEASEILEALPLYPPVEYTTSDILGKGSSTIHKGIIMEEAILIPTKTFTMKSSIDSEMPSFTEPYSDQNTSNDIHKSWMSKSPQRRPKKVAFVAVQISKPSESEWNQANKKVRLDLLPSTMNEALFSGFPSSESQNNSYTLDHIM